MLLALVLAFATEDERVYGAPLPQGSTKVDEGRYLSSRSYDDTLEFYEKLYKREAHFRPIITGPNLRAVHLLNPQAQKGGGWSGMNIYELGGKVKIFVLKAEGEAQPPPTKKRGKKS